MYERKPMFLLKTLILVRPFSHFWFVCAEALAKINIFRKKARMPLLKPIFWKLEEIKNNTLQALFNILC